MGGISFISFVCLHLFFDVLLSIIRIFGDRQHERTCWMPCDYSLCIKGVLPPVEWSIILSLLLYFVPL